MTNIVQCKALQHYNVCTLRLSMYIQIFYRQCSLQVPVAEVPEAYKNLVAFFKILLPL